MTDDPDREAWKMKTIGRKAMKLDLNVRSESECNALLWYESSPLSEKDDGDDEKAASVVVKE